MNLKGAKSGLVAVFLQLIIQSSGFTSRTTSCRSSYNVEILTDNVMRCHMAVHTDNEFDTLKLSFKKKLRSALGLAVGCSLLLSTRPPAFAEEWTDKNRLAAEAWRAVDEIYYDRTFNGNDWFKLRQEIVKTDYKTDEEVYTKISAMLTKLGDKYTRFLAPAQYTALMNSAQGELTGVGLELQVPESNAFLIDVCALRISHVIHVIDGTFIHSNSDKKSRSVFVPIANPFAFYDNYDHLDSLVFHSFSNLLFV